jgi:hypothetical protein
MYKSSFLHFSHNSLVASLALAFCFLSGNAFGQVSESDINVSAPTKYMVKKGDTLWGISGVFLKHPWMWPKIWGMNKAKIHNPDLIYPGNIIFLKNINGEYTLQIGDSLSSRMIGDTVYLSPSIIYEDNDLEPISVIPAEVIAPFIDKAIVVDTMDLLSGPIITAAQDGHINLGSGSSAYVQNSTSKNGSRFSIFRPGNALIDPESGDTLGFEVNYLGAAKITRQGDQTHVAKILITSSSEEISVGDRLIEVSDTPIASYLPHVPDAPINGAIVAIHGHSNQNGSHSNLSGYKNEAGALSIIILNKGISAGVEIGHTFIVSQSSKSIIPRNSLGYKNGEKMNDKEMILPEEESAQVMVFKTFDKVSYAIILSSSNSVQSGDKFSSP